MTAGLLADAFLPAAPPAGDDSVRLLVPAVRRVLTAAVSSADLVSLELRVGGEPQLAVVAVARCTEVVPGLSLWATTIAPCAWHDGVVLVATAVSSDASRRVAVHGAATLVADLLIAERRRLEAEARARQAVELAGVDALTGLGNRRTWRQALDAEAGRSRRYARPSSVVVVDLDGLKEVNDEHGHARGDSYLQSAAAAVRDASRSTDVVCRLGGDEFGVLAAETGPEGAQQLGDRLRVLLAGAGVRASVGVASVDDGDLDRAWHLADQEMYRHKRLRRSAGS